MSVQENKDIVKRNFEAPWTEETIAAFAQQVPPDFVEHYPDKDRTFEESLQYEAQMYAAFPDVRSTIDELIGEGDFVVVRWTARGTFLGDYMGIKPTGKPVEVTGVEIIRLVDGKPQESWIQVDRLGMLQQMGALPELAAVPA